MNQEPDPLEIELAAFRPQQPSPKLFDRIAAELDVARAAAGPQAADASRSPVRWIRWSLAAAAIAAGIGGALWLWPDGDRAVQPELASNLTQPAPASAFDDSLPSVWTYRSVLTSPSDLEPLLDQHARRPSAESHPEQTRGFVPVTMKLNSELGEL